jgi:hypothetical protein
LIKASHDCEKQRQTEAILVYKKHIVRFPEATVEPGILGGLSSCFGKFMYLRQREMPVRQSEAGAEITLHPLDNRVRGATMRALVIAVFE